MGQRSFVIAGDRAALIANDNTDFRYRAAVHHVPAGVMVPLRRHDAAETQFMVENGLIEFMIGGAAGMVMAGDFARVPAGMSYAYRNAGDGTARLLVRSVSPLKLKPAIRLMIGSAA